MRDRVRMRGFGRFLRAAERPIPVNLVRIAAATVDAGAHLVSLDGDFDRIGPLERTVLAA